MTFFPDDFDPSAPVLGLIGLCEIDTADGTARFMTGVDGVFVDTDGRQWWGSQLIEVSSMESALGGVAPPGTITLSFFQDPNADDLVAQMRELGLEYIEGREIRFFVQPIKSQAEFYAPKAPPVRWMTRVMRTLSASANGAQDRSIKTGFEAWSENRKSARRITLNTEGHAKLIGRENPSLEFMPTSDFEKEKLFG